MMSRMRCWLGMVLLSCAPVMAGEWIQKGVDSFSTGLFGGRRLTAWGKYRWRPFAGSTSRWMRLPPWPEHLLGGAAGAVGWAAGCGRAQALGMGWPRRERAAGRAGALSAARRN